MNINKRLRALAVSQRLRARRVGSFDSTVLSPRSVWAQNNKTAFGGSAFGLGDVGSAIQTVYSNPVAPAGTTSLTGVMMGLALAITPKRTGRIRIRITGQQGNNTTADGSTVQAAFGTGTAPVNGAAATGTLIGNPKTWTSLTGVLNANFELESDPTSAQTVGIALWVDLNLKAVTGGTASLANLDTTVEEV